MLQHGAHLHLRHLEPAGPLQRDLQVPAGVAEAALARGLLAEVAVVEHLQLAAEGLRDRGHVAAHVGDHPDADLVADLGDTFSLVDGSLRNWSPNYVLACGNSFVIALMERMLGALPETIDQPFERPLSEIELDLAQMVLGKMGEVLRSGVNAQGGFETTLERVHNFEDRPQPDEALAPEFGVAIRLVVELGKVTSELALVIPQRAFLKTRVVMPKAKGQSSKAKDEWHERLTEQVRRSQVTLEARVRLQSLTLGIISRLAAGDVIAFQDKGDVTVQVRANGMEMYACELGRSGERYTVRVKDNISTDDEILDHLMG